MENSVWKERVWDVIDNYFKNTENNLSRNQLDSFNTFLNIQISKTIRQFNPITLIYNEFTDGDGNKSHKFNLEIIIGGSCNVDIPDEGIELRDDIVINNDGMGIMITKPIIQEVVGTQIQFKQLLPNEARLKNLTYKTDIKCEIFFKYYNNDTRKGFVYKTINSLGNIPIMLHSQSCALSSMNNEMLYEMGECPYDQGGYFIIDGKEKVIIAQERQVENRIYMNIKPDDKIFYQAEVRSVKENSFEPAQIVHVNMYEDNTIKIKLPDITEEIPLFILFRALGIVGDKSIINTIINNTDNSDNKLIDQFQNLLYPSLVKSKHISTEFMANDFIKNKINNSPICSNKDQTDTFLKNIIYNKLFPHTGVENISKAYFLAYMVNEILLCKLSLQKKTDRDSFINKRIDVSGFLIGTIFRDLYFRIKNDIEHKINKEYYNVSSESIEKADLHWESVDFNTFLTSEFRNKLVNRKIMDEGFLYAFKNCWGLKNARGCKDGIVQDLNRLNFLGYISHIRRINMPLSDSAKVREPHSLHASSFGTICPYETPDGGNIGLRKNFTIFTQVTFGTNSAPLLRCLYDNNLKNIIDVNINELGNSCRVFLNENIVGVHFNPDLLEYKLKLLRRNALINIYTSIVWYKSENIIKITTTSGRLCRPILIVDKKKLLITSDIVDKINTNELNWKYLVGGTRNLEYKKEAYDEYDDKYHYTDETIEYMERHKSVIEYLDTEEINISLIAMMPEDLLKSANQLYNYTHCEIHPSLMLGVTAICLPLIERNQAPRNQYSCAQSKQAVGMYATNFRNRMDTKGQIIYYPQKPLVQSKMSKYLFNNVLPQGINAIVAIASYSGYNQEDSILISKAALERGLFNTITFKTFSNREEIFSDKRREVFRKPDLNKTENIKNGNYSKLDENGFIREGVKANENDIMISKIVVDTEFNTEHDNSEYVKKNDSGIVDKVYYNSGNENQKYCKIRLRKEKIPEVGDKFCSRFGQKGTIGMVVEEIDLPYTKDGIIPDIIINPHAIPSRMTIGQLLETLLGKVSVNSGILSSQVQFSEIDFTKLGEILEHYKYEKTCNEILYNGRTGDQIKVDIFIGHTFYQRLTHQVAEKFYTRPEGPKSTLIRQPIGGRSLGGGLRIGEMERDAILANGISGFMKETMMERSDKYNFHISDKSGLISIVNKEDNIFSDLSNDSIIINNEDGSGTKISNNISDSNFVNIETPYAFKLLLQEFESMSIGMRLMVDKSDDWQKYSDTEKKILLSKFSQIKMDFDISKKYTHLIGKNGHKIKSLELLYSSKIKIYDNNTDPKLCTVVIHGLKDNIELLRNEIKELENYNYNTHDRDISQYTLNNSQLESEITEHQIDLLSSAFKVKTRMKLGIIIPVMDTNLTTKTNDLSILTNIQIFKIVNSLLKSKELNDGELNYNIFLVSGDKDSYNYGALMNIGVKMALENNCDYVILQNPSLIPTEYMLREYKIQSDIPINLSYNIDKIIMPLDKDITHVLKINIKQFYRVNGFPNHIHNEFLANSLFLERLNLNKISVQSYPKMYSTTFIINDLKSNISLTTSSTRADRSDDPGRVMKDVSDDDSYEIFDTKYKQLELQLIQKKEREDKNYDLYQNEYLYSESTNELSGIKNNDWYFTEQQIVLNDKPTVQLHTVKFNTNTLPYYENLPLPADIPTISTQDELIDIIYKYLNLVFKWTSSDISIHIDNESEIPGTITLTIDNKVIDTKIKEFSNTSLEDINISDTDSEIIRNLNDELIPIKKELTEFLNDLDTEQLVDPDKLDEKIPLYDILITNTIKITKIYMQYNQYSLAKNVIDTVMVYFKEGVLAPEPIEFIDWDEKLINYSDIVIIQLQLDESLKLIEIKNQSSSVDVKELNPDYTVFLYMTYVKNRFEFLQKHLLLKYNNLLNNISLINNTKDITSKTITININVPQSTIVELERFSVNSSYKSITYNHNIINSIDFIAMNKYIINTYIPLKLKLDTKYKNLKYEYLSVETMPYLDYNLINIDTLVKTKYKNELDLTELNECEIIELIGKYLMYYDYNTDNIFYIDISTGIKCEYIYGYEFGDDDELEDYNVYYKLILYKLSNNKFKYSDSDTELETNIDSIPEYDYRKGHSTQVFFDGPYDFKVFPNLQIEPEPFADTIDTYPLNESGDYTQSDKKHEVPTEELISTIKTAAIDDIATIHTAAIEDITTIQTAAIEDIVTIQSGTIEDVETIQTGTIEDVETIQTRAIEDVNVPFYP